MEVFDFFATEGWSSLFAFLNTGLSCRFCSEVLLKIGESAVQEQDFVR